MHALTRRLKIYSDGDARLVIGDSTAVVIAWVWCFNGRADFMDMWGLHWCDGCRSTLMNGHIECIPMVVEWRQ